MIMEWLDQEIGIILSFFQPTFASLYSPGKTEGPDQMFFKQVSMGMSACWEDSSHYSNDVDEYGWSAMSSIGVHKQRSKYHNYFFSENWRFDSPCSESFLREM
jgi:hypothetical protein